MALNTVGDIISEVLVRNNRTTTDSFITDAILRGWIRDAHVESATYAPWPFTEARDKTLAWDGSEEIDYSSFDVNYRSDSIRWLRIGDKRLQKLNFDDYEIFRESRPGGDDRVFSDYNRVLYINPSADVSGTIAAYGQYLPTIDPTDLTATTIFSTYDTDGNEAIVEKMTSYLKNREHLTNEANLHKQIADAKLEKLWTRITDEQHAYHTSRDRGGMWKHIDVIGGFYEDEFYKRNQF